MRDALSGLAVAIRTNRFRRWPYDAMSRACDIARAERSETVEAQHLLLALLQRADASTARALNALGVTEQAVRNALDNDFVDALDMVGIPRAVASQPHPATSSPPTKPRWGPSATLVLQRALQIAADRGDARVTDQHLLTALGEAEAGVVARLCASLDLNSDPIQAALG